MVRPALPASGDTLPAMNAFSSRIIQWQQIHGRNSLPWQHDRDPYRIWLSEIMLQQTQVATVIPYFERFIERYPTLFALAAAHEDDVLALWSGLGYYSRARNLHAAARVVVEHHAGAFPNSPNDIERLPGVGRSTAAAVAALAFGQRCAILDGNVKRVLARHGGISGWPGEKAIESSLWMLAESRLPKHHIEAYTQGMMDLGALVCTRSKPACEQCPVSSDCVAHRQHLTDTLPTARPRKILPERQIQMLILLARDEILLEKRPSRGIWGGLWSLPELATELDPIHYCLERFGSKAENPAPLPRLSHSFTHFKLHIHPVKLHLKSRSIATPGQQWLSLSEALNAALPTPIRKLVTQLKHC